MAPKACCICRRSGKKNPSSFRKSAPYERDFECCFGPAAENRAGWLCPTCKDAVATKFRKHHETSEQLLDQKGKLGSKGHSKHGKRVKSTALPALPWRQSTPRQNHHHDHMYSSDHSTVSLTSKHALTVTLRPSNIANVETPVVASSRAKIKPRVLLPVCDDHDDENKDPRKRANPNDSQPHRAPPVAKKVKGSHLVKFLGHDVPIEIVDVVHKLQKENDALKRTLCIPNTGPLTQSQKETLSKLIRNRQANLDTDGLLVVNHRRGKPTKLLEIPSTQQSSSSAAASTKVRRAKLIEKVTNVLSSTSNVENDVHHQLVTVIKRNKDTYAKAAQAAGLKIVGRFTKETVLALRSMMTQTMWRLIRRTLKTEIGHDVFMTESTLKSEIREVEFEYECGTLENSAEDRMPFVRVTNVTEVITKMVNSLREAGFLQHLENCPDETLWLHLSADKGGKSTKLIVQVINVNEKGRHSIKHCKILGFFEGKDNDANIRGIFGPVIEELQQLCKDISNLKLKRPEFTNPPLQREPTPDDLNFAPLEQLNRSNRTVSYECKYCKKAMAPIKSTKKGKRLCARRRRKLKRKLEKQRMISDTSTHTIGSSYEPQSREGLHVHSPSQTSSCVEKQTDQIFTSAKLTVGGDWEWEARFMGLSGPNGKYFCNSCLVILSDMPKQVPHALTILPKYQDRTHGRSNVLPDDEDFLRTFDECHAKNAEFVAAGGNKKHAQKYNNCIQPPLINGPEYVIDVMSTSPLHISLGLGLQILNVVENSAIHLDKQVKDAEGEFTAFDAVFQHQKDILKKCQALNRKIETTEDKIAQAKKRKVEIVKARAKFFKKNNRGQYIHRTDLAHGVRTEFEKLGSDIKEYETEIGKTKKTLKTREAEVRKTADELNLIKGPFKSRFDEVLRSLSLKRAVYHSGSLIGPDVRKLASFKNIPKFASVFSPLEMDTPSGKSTFSSWGQCAKITTLLNKFAQCYELYNKNRTLCAHEVELLAIRCVSFGNWFPVNYPEENLKRKLHLLAVEVPRQVRRLWSIGMITEQTIESLHPYVNKLDRMFCTVQDPRKKGALICRQHNMFTESSLPHLK